jgi:hypothetical protein
MKKKLYFCVILLMALSAALYAQNPPSLTANSTMGLFMADKDYYLSPTYFYLLPQNVLFLQFGMPGSTDTKLRVGTGLFQGNLYFGGYYGGSLSLASGDITTEIDNDLILSGTTIIGKTETRTVTVDESADTTNDVCLIFGMKGLGPIKALGVTNEFLQSDYSTIGSYNPAYPGGWSVTAWPAISISSGATATTSTTMDTAGNVQSIASQAYGNGGSFYKSISDELSVGLALPISTIDLTASASVEVAFNTDYDTGSFEGYNSQTGAGYAAYTPTTALPGATAAAINDLYSYQFRDANVNQNDTTITANANVQADLHFGSWTVSPLLGYTLTLPMYSNSYRDDTGAAQTVAGYGSDFYRFQYAVAMDTVTGLMGSTTTVDRIFEAQTRSDITNLVAPGVKVIVKPSDVFTFGFCVQPQITFQSTSDSYTRRYVTTVTHDDGTGTAGINSYVQVDTTDWAGYGTNTTNFRLENVAATGAQFYLIPEKLRINVGGIFFNTIINTNVAETTTTGINTHEQTIAYSGSTTSTVTAYDVNSDVRATYDATQVQTDSSSSAFWGAEGGFTFFFSKDMFIDLFAKLTTEGNSFIGYWQTGDIFSLTTWTAEMTIRY